MNLKLGEKIRDLRKKQNRTQENIADALGVTGQAVSRWEQGISYPDMELVPSIANYFGITIDELFGYENDRDHRIDAILEKNEILGREDMGVDVHLDERIKLLRDALTEFPSNEKLLFALADTLSQAGWIRLGEDFIEDDDYQVHNIAYHQQNPYWNEAMPIFARLIDEAKDDQLRYRAVRALILLYNNIGEYDKGTELADRMPDFWTSRQILRVNAVDGKRRETALGKAVIDLVDLLQEQVMQLMMVKNSNFGSEMPVKKVQAMIELIGAIFEDGNFGWMHTLVADLYLYLSTHQWRIGDKDGAFESLDHALEHARIFDSFAGKGKMHYTAQLFKNVEFEVVPKEKTSASTLPFYWPIWMLPDHSDVKAEITADPRWDAWVERCCASNNG